MTNPAADAAYMARALMLARRGRYSTRPNPAVGCVLVRDGVVVGEGWHRRVGEPHAEALALAAAGDGARGATCYVTLEPCAHHGRTPPCADALVAAGVARVVAAHADPHPLVAGAGFARLRAAGVSVETGLLAGPAAALNRGFLMRMRAGRPLVRAKLAVSLDGRTALANGASRWITSVEARRDVHRARAACGAILTGVGTVLADDPELTARDLDFELELAQPLRVVADSALRTPLVARVVTGAGRCLIYSADVGPAAEALRQAGVEVLALTGGARPDPHAMLADLARRAVNEVWLEAGPTLTGAFLEAGLIDELVVYVAAAVLGAQARPMLTLPLIEDLRQARRFRLCDERRVGPDLRLTLAPASGSNDAPAGFP